MISTSLGDIEKKDLFVFHQMEAHRELYQANTEHISEKLEILKEEIAFFREKLRKKGLSKEMRVSIFSIIEKLNNQKEALESDTYETIANTNYIDDPAWHLHQKSQSAFGTQ
jgi:hypothetical protein